eukprot:GHVH01004352.1.p1 GENE.GHVH01004352.1~~GHVH01004352.1.p1  ORF type:complete len:310 (-),score=43.19 GHVH01004352.1:279-1208(-)
MTNKLLLRIWTNLRQFTVPQKRYRFFHLGPFDDADRTLLERCPFETLHITHPACLSNDEVETFKICASRRKAEKDTGNTEQEYIDHDIILLNGYWTGARIIRSPDFLMLRPPLHNMIHLEHLEDGPRAMLSEFIAIASALRTSLCLKSFESLVSMQCRALPSIQNKKNNPGIFQELTRRIYGTSGQVIKHSAVSLTPEESKLMEGFVNCENILAETYVSMMDVKCGAAFNDSSDMYWYSDISYSLWKEALDTLHFAARLKVLDYRQGLLREAIVMLGGDDDVAAEHRPTIVLIVLLILCSVVILLKRHH